MEETANKETANKEISNKEMQKKRMLSYFIEATQQIMEEEGLENISIRKIAKRAGYNSATIYNYFTDIDQLILLASMKYFRNYTIALSKHIREDGDPYQNFLNVWNFFCDTSLEYPQIFYNLFFNKHSAHLDEIVKIYYGIFPDELGVHAPIIQEMFTGQSISERNRKLMLPLVQSGDIQLEFLDTANDICIYCFKAILQQKCAEGSQANSKKLKEKMLAILCYLIRKQ